MITLFRRPLNKFVFCAALFLLVGVAIVGGQQVWRPKPSWQNVEQWIEIRYPDVRSVSTEMLASFFEARKTLPTSDAGQFLLLDTRTSAEFALSRIPMAIHVSAEMISAFAQEQSARKHQKIIVYCAVGIRSAAVAEQLQSLGFTNVFNLSGSIFQWANEKRALEGGQVVHPFDETWGSLLK